MTRRQAAWILILIADAGFGAWGVAAVINGLNTGLTHPIAIAF